MANVQMDYKDFPLKQCGFSLKLRFAEHGPKTGNQALDLRTKTKAVLGQISQSSAQGFAKFNPGRNRSMGGR